MIQGVSHKMKKLLVILLLINTVTAFGYVDLNLGYSFNKREVEGVKTIAEPDPGKAVSRTTSYQLMWAWYIWDYTALELNYSHQQENLKDTREVATTDETITIKSIDSTIITQVAGAGIRQAFAGRNSRIIPSIGIGYAKYITSGSTIYTIDNEGTEETLRIEKDKKEVRSSYVSFMLRFRLATHMALTLAAKSVMPDFEAEKADENVTYSAGISWQF